MPLINSSPFKSPPPAPAGWRLDGPVTYDSVTRDMEPPTSVETGGVIEFAHDGMSYFTTDTGSGSTPQVHRYLLNTAYSLNDVASTQSELIDVLSGTSTPKVFGVYFRNDGLRMYVSSFDLESVGLIHQYTLSSAYAITTAVRTNSWTTPWFEPGGLCFDPDGDFCFICASGQVHMLTLGTAWAISTASLTTSYNPAGTWNPFDVQIDTVSGLKLFMSNDDDATVYQDAMGSAWNLAGANSSSRLSFNPGGEMASGLAGMAWKWDDGLKMWLSDNPGDTNVYQYSTP